MDDEKLDRLVELTEALLRIRLSEMLEKELDSPKKKELFELTSQNMSVRETSKVIGLSTGKISELWQRWHSMGMLRKEGKFYRKYFEDETENV